MMAIELIKFCSKILKSLSEVDVRINDYHHIEMYDKYVRMVGAGYKKEYVKRYLAETYNTSESSVTRIVSRFSRSVKI